MSDSKNYDPTTWFLAEDELRALLAIAMKYVPLDSPNDTDEDAEIADLRARVAKLKLDA